jgi:thiamine-monophosphate kinase
VLTSTILGEAAPEDIIYRSGASVGDIIYVTGTLGDSALGLKGLEVDGPTAITRSPFREAVRRHLDPRPRLNIAKTIARNNLATSMMDISDGVASDLHELVKESNVSAVVDISKLPHSEDMAQYMIKEVGAMEMMLAGGEDYELLFTSKPENEKEIQRLAKEENLRVTSIGLMEEKTEKSPTVRFVDGNGIEVDIKEKGFDHFL